MTIEPTASAPLKTARLLPMCVLWLIQIYKASRWFYKSEVWAETIDELPGEQMVIIRVQFLKGHQHPVGGIGWRKNPFLHGKTSDR